jgi:hypothetical protein
MAYARFESSDMHASQISATTFAAQNTRRPNEPSAKKSRR